MIAITKFKTTIPTFLRRIKKGFRGCDMTGNSINLIGANFDYAHGANPL